MSVSEAQLEKQANQLLCGYDGIYTESQLRIQDRQLEDRMCKAVIRGTDGDAIPPPPPKIRLTKRQRQLAQFAARYNSIEQTARHFGVSKQTVRRTLSRAATRVDVAVKKHREIVGLKHIIELEFGATLRSNWPIWLIWLSDERLAGRL